MKLKYYIFIVLNNNIDVRTLQRKIKNREYWRINEESRKRLVKNEKLELIDTVKNPILIKNAVGVEDISERMLQKLILEDITSFLDELG